MWLERDAHDEPREGVIAIRHGELRFAPGGGLPTRAAPAGASAASSRRSGRTIEDGSCSAPNIPTP